MSADTPNEDWWREYCKEYLAQPEIALRHTRHLDSIVEPVIAILTPSRGLIHSRTLEAVLANMAGRSYAGWCLTHDLPIPDCHNAVVEQAMRTDANLFWFVEEDMIPPPDALSALLSKVNEGCGMAIVDYPVGEKPSQNCAIHEAYMRGEDDPTGALIWCGMGCTLIRREVFERMERPWFRTDKTIQYIRFGSSKLTDLKIIDREVPYGGQDIWFGHQATRLGYSIGCVSSDRMTCGHAKLRQRGPEQTNNGAHTIEVVTQIDRWH